MGQKPYSDEDEVKHAHPAADVETVVVDPDDIVETMRRNSRDRDRRQQHVLRATPPLEGDTKATLFVTEAGNYYPPDMNPTPIHLSAESFVVGHSSGSGHPALRDDLTTPNERIQWGLFCRECEVPEGPHHQLTDEEQHKWDEWWDEVTEVWESAVRHALTSTDSLTITHTSPTIEDTTVAVRFPSDNNE